MDLTFTSPRSDDDSEYVDRVRTGANGARTRASERGELLRHEVGDRLFDLLAERFPEEYQARRREERIRAFGAGIAVGFLGRELVRFARR